ncbi:MAG: ATP-binding cassette domain-containing protein [Planctomycetota bacterium]|jgi:ABC-type ATPase with predicted acetyltransferase domain
MDRTIQIEVSARFQTRPRVSRRVGEVAGMFGLDPGAGQTVEVLRPTLLRLGPGRVVFVTGASGGGKSTLLRRAGEALSGRDDVRVVDLNAVAWDQEASLIDTLGADLEEATRLLSLAGLNEASLMLRPAVELSEGQRHRYRLAKAMESAGDVGEESWTVLLADEFGSLLDRVTSKVLARNAARWARRERVCLIAATAHDDLLESMAPDTLVVTDVGGDVEVFDGCDGGLG